MACAAALVAPGGLVMDELWDRGRVAREVFGSESIAAVRASVDAVFSAVPTVSLPDLRKPFVRRSDVERLLEDGLRTWDDGKVA